MEMRKLGVLFAALALLIPIFGSAQGQEDESFDAFVSRINAECPINSGSNWALQSFTTAGDTVVVELQVPASLAPFMSLLTDKSKNVKRLWIREMSGFGERWNTFVERLVEADRMLKINFNMRGQDAAAGIVLKPSDFKKE